MFNYQPVSQIANILIDHHRVWTRRYIQPFAILMNSISTAERTEYYTSYIPVLPIALEQKYHTTMLSVETLSKKTFLNQLKLLLLQQVSTFSHWSKDLVTKHLVVRKEKELTKVFMFNRACFLSFQLKTFSKLC